jgi:hypothetical protein
MGYMFVDKIGIVVSYIWIINGWFTVCV